MRPFCLLAILAVLLPLAAAVPGGWSPIKDINDPHVKEIAEFAVSEYNKESGKKLELQRVVKGETQVVAGQNFRLLLAVKDDTTAAKYVGVVYERVWEHTRKLLSFDQVKK
ncbi:PREDICTED: cysteine proteinase inhibitor 5-like [Fragaria vesca subsp. vesca]|uniref:cysteine proteinase inhibitor 5-like n=1 Tax=Fragaria vesca subsp. vesca TaxID=101020 RepID=UPI0002C2FDC1|nr:PREDICTED: cysteine proteinase inhibitor 5-like [Fragaria vesca subsp. vesca]